MKKLIPDGLRPSAIFPTALDDQWIDRNSLYNNTTLDKTALTKAADLELKKCLLAGEQVVINRAFIINSDAVVRYSEDNTKESMLKTLVGNGSIVPYLMYANDELFGEDAKIASASENLKSWCRFVDGLDPHCLRFNWDDESNKTECDTLLSGRFRSWLEKLCDPQAALLFANFCRYRGGVSAADICNFSRFLKDEFSPFLAECEGVTRGKLYSKFGLFREQIVPDQNVNHQALKQMVDVIYNSNLSDALGITPVTAKGSATRAALSEDTEPNAPTLEPRDAARLIIEASKLFTSWRSDDRGRLPDLVVNQLSYSQIRDIRGYDEWDALIKQSVRLSAPLADGEREDPVASVLARLRSAEEAGQQLRVKLMQHFNENEYWARPNSSGQRVIDDFVIALGTTAFSAASGVISVYLPEIGAAAGAVVSAAGGAMASEFARTIGFRPAQAWDLLIGPSAMDTVGQVIPRFELENPREAACEIVSILNSQNGLDVDETTTGSTPSFSVEGHNHGGTDAPALG